MTKTIERPMRGTEVPPGLFVPQIKNDFTRRDLLAGDRDGANISEERLLDRDLLLWNIGFYQQLEEELEDNRLYQKLDVACEGRDIFLSDEVLSGALPWATVLSIPYALDKLPPMLAAAVDGDPESTSPGS